MRILIDFQGAQTASRFRGIGRYSTSLVAALLRNAGPHEIYLLLNAAFQDSVLEIRQEFADLILPERICMFDVPLQVAQFNSANTLSAQVSEQVREYAIQQLKPDAVLLTSLFEGYVDNAVTSVGAFTSGVRTAVILYDLIPFLNPERYCAIEQQRKYYFRKIESLKKAGLLLAISDYSRDSAMEHLHVSPEKVVTISSAVDSFFKPQTLSAEVINALYKRYGITRKMILYVPGGFDARKNFQALITAYSLLPQAIRADYQLVIASKLNVEAEHQLAHMCSSAGLTAEDVRLTNYVPNDDLVSLYNLASLFVFPSLEEGFGLPILEAMRCGAVVIGSNTTSIPSVIGCEEALFDPTDPAAIAAKMLHVLEDKNFREQLQARQYAHAQTFSWDYSAQLALQALEEKINPQSLKKNLDIEHLKIQKPHLAFVSPLPPERTGIADYSAELLPELMQYYDVELITDQAHIELPFALTQRSVAWFEKHAKNYDRILYQIGNSPFHTHMFALLQRYPGVIVLHDFFLSGVFAYEEISGQHPGLWTQALFYSHGYWALQSRFHAQTMAMTKDIYPCNLKVLQKAKGVIVHSDYSKQLARKWYGPTAAADWTMIPLLRAPAPMFDQAAARLALGLKTDDFVVCSFGLIDPTKQTLRLVQAWLSSQLNQQRSCKLIFAGANHGGEYGADLMACIKQNNCLETVIVTGWLDESQYNLYLQAADMAVQLRVLSRGETSAAVLGCLNYGLPTIVNAHGAMAQLPATAVWMLADEFTDAELIQALECLWKNKQKCEELSVQARALVHTEHAPVLCAKRYAETIETIYQETAADEQALFNAMLSLDGFSKERVYLNHISQVCAYHCVPKLRQKQLFIDVTNISRNDLKTGIERVVRAQLLELIKAVPAGFRVEPVYLSKADKGVWHYRYANAYTLKILNLPACVANANSPVDVGVGDIFYAADFAPYEMIAAAEEGLFMQWQMLGVQIHVLVYDLLPVLNPEFFPAGAGAVHAQWLKTMSQYADHLIGISRTVRDELNQWLLIHGPARKGALKLSAAPLGADINASVPTQGLPADAKKILSMLEQTKTFLMVGTIEPRKGHLQTLAAFEELWRTQHDVNLVIVGKEGWTSLPEQDRRTIPDIVRQLKNHAELNKRLFWLQDISDEYLEALYTAATCVIVASEGEGFGLPLIEAMHYECPVIARDLPVFREVAAEHAYYFKGLAANDLANAIKTWLTLYEQQQVPTLQGLSWKTWQQHAQELLAIFLQESAPEREWMPISSAIKQKAMDEHLQLIHAARIEMASTLLPPADIILDLGGANCPLYKIGYPHTFKKLTLIDLPPDERHDYYKDIVVDDEGAAGEVVIHYTDMTTLSTIVNNSVDLVWSGQSIEHVPQLHAERMCREVFRVLKKGGSFCLDTPNRFLTRIHTRSCGGGFIHPEHCIEYFPEQLQAMLQTAGFEVKKVFGICEMPVTVASDEFHYEDFMLGKKVTDEVNKGYIQFFHCVKPE